MAPIKYPKKEGLVPGGRAVDVSPILPGARFPSASPPFKSMHQSASCQDQSIDDDDVGGGGGGTPLNERLAIDGPKLQTGQRRPRSLGRGKYTFSGE